MKILLLAIFLAACDPVYKPGDCLYHKGVYSFVRVSKVGKYSYGFCIYHKDFNDAYFCEGPHSQNITDFEVESGGRVDCLEEFMPERMVHGDSK